MHNEGFAETRFLLHHKYDGAHDGHGGHPHHGRRGGRARRGESKFLLLDALQNRPQHGYELIKSLEERSGGQYAPSPGVVYPTLQFLDEAGWVRAHQDGERRVFHVTGEGQKALTEHADEVAEFWAQFTPPSDLSARAEVGFVYEELGYLERTVRASLQGNPDTERVRGVRQAVENCRNQVRGLIAAGSPEPLETQ